MTNCENLITIVYLYSKSYDGNVKGPSITLPLFLAQIQLPDRSFHDGSISRRLRPRRHHSPLKKFPENIIPRRQHFPKVLKPDDHVLRPSDGINERG